MESAAATELTAEDAGPGLVIRRLGLRHYRPVWEEMRAFTAARGAGAPDQIWLAQHHPVFTQGSGCRALPRAGDGGAVAAGADGDGFVDGFVADPAAEIPDIPVVHSDRGGDITYHAPGQLIAYLLLDLKRRRLGVKSLVARIEQAVIDLLGGYGLAAARRPGAPGVYLRAGKIAALGLRVSRGCCYHGVSVNVDLDLRPYQSIDPCGIAGLEVTHLAAHLAAVDIAEVEDELARRLAAQFGG